MKKENFDTPQWRKYFKTKSPEEVEKIKKLFENSKFKSPPKDREIGKKRLDIKKKGKIIIQKFCAVMILLLFFSSWVVGTIYPRWGAVSFISFGLFFVVFGLIGVQARKKSRERDAIYNIMRDSLEDPVKKGEKVEIVKVNGEELLVKSDYQLKHRQ